jgi:ceramide glucosyltransferase
MTLVSLSAGAFCAIATLLHIASIAVVVARVRRPLRPSAVLERDEGISIVRPLCGIENFSEATLASSFNLNYRHYEILFCVAQPHDPVIPVVQRLIDSHPDVPARLLVGNDRISDNPKLNNVVKGWNAASYAWIVMSDSNVLMPADYLQELFGTWAADTGVVSSPAIGSRPEGFWAELECAFLNTYQARWQCFADDIGMGFAQGKTMLYRRDLIEAAGGIRALGSELAEDAASTKIVRRQGLRVRVVNRPFDQPLGRRTAAEVWRRQIRWARLRRDTFLPFFLPELLAGCFPPLAALTFFIITNGWPLLFALPAFVALWYGAEASLAVMAGWKLSRRSPFAWLIRDALLPVLWCASWLGNGFVWRDNAMRIADRGSTA